MHKILYNEVNISFGRVIPVLEDNQCYSDTVLSNIEEIDKNQNRWLQLKICELASLADEVSAYVLNLAESLSIERDDIIDVLAESFVFPQSIVLNQTTLFTDDFDVVACLSSLSSFEKAVLTGFIYQRLNNFGVILTETELLKSRCCDESFTYLKNALADEAYDVFSQDFDDPRVAYSESFKEAAAAASDKRVGYCILPLEEKGGARAAGFMNLLFSSDLKIVAVTSVFGFDGNADVKYALLSSEFKIPDYEKGDDRYLELLLPQNEDIELSSVLISQKTLGVEVYRINTVILDSDEDTKNYYHLVLKTQAQNFAVSLIYFSLFCKGYVPIGLYRNLE